MKNVIALSLIAIFILPSCTEERPPEPKPHKELIVGEWYSTKVKHFFGVGDDSETLDSAQTNVKLTFTEDFYVYTELIDSVAPIYGFTYDTSRYNFNEDTLYFIKNALAQDTFIVKSINEAELSLIVEEYKDNIAGAFVTRQTIFDFTR